MTETPDTDVEQSLVFACDLDAPPEQVWRALTERELLAQWLLPNGMRAQVGDRLLPRAPANDDAPRAPVIDCEVLEADPPHRLRLAWREGPRGPGGLDSTVTFVLSEAANGGTRLLIVHDGFAAAPLSRRAPVMSCAPLRLAA
jgi:uncharacterized protein YndB with AHSA1/START domain